MRESKSSGYFNWVVGIGPLIIGGAVVTGGVIGVLGGGLILGAVSETTTPLVLSATVESVWAEEPSALQLSPQQEKVLMLKPKSPQTSFYGNLYNKIVR